MPNNCVSKSCRFNKDEEKFRGMVEEMSTKKRSGSLNCVMFLTSSLKLQGPRWSPWLCALFLEIRRTSNYERWEILKGIKLEIFELVR